MSKRGEPTTLDLLLAKDWSHCTYKEIAEAIGRSPNTVAQVAQRHKAETGIEIPHAKPKPVIDRIREMDCTNLTAKEIAKELGVNLSTVYNSIHEYQKKTGKEIPHKVDSRGHGNTRPTVLESLLKDDWSDLPPSEIAWTLGVKRITVMNVLREYKKRTGNEIPHAPEPKKRKEDA